jgi:hypothetical protein
VTWSMSTGSRRAEMSPVTQTLEPPSTIRSSDAFSRQMRMEEVESPRNPHTRGKHVDRTILSGVDGCCGGW